MDSRGIDVVVLCGGLGKRLKSVLPHHLPKSMVDINKRPFLDILVDSVAKFGFRRFILCIGYKANIIREHFQNNRELLFVFSEEKELLGTGGALKNCESLLESNVLLVLNGDTFCPLDMSSFLNFHMKRGGIASIVISQVNNRMDGGFIQVNKNDRIISFNEKRSVTQAAYLNAGIYMLERKVLSFIPSGRPCSLEYETFPLLLEKEIYGYLTHETIYDIGTPERLDVFRRYELSHSVKEVN